MGGSELGLVRFVFLAGARLICLLGHKTKEGMDLDKISKLCESLCLDEKDSPLISLDKKVYTKGSERLKLCLVGKEARKYNCESRRY